MTTTVEYSRTNEMRNYLTSLPNGKHMLADIRAHFEQLEGEHFARDGVASAFFRVRNEQGCWSQGEIAGEWVKTAPTATIPTQPEPQQPFPLQFETEREASYLALEWATPVEDPWGKLLNIIEENRDGFKQHPNLPAYVKHMEEHLPEGYRLAITYTGPQ